MTQRETWTAPAVEVALDEDREVRAARKAVKAAEESRDRVEKALAAARAGRDALAQEAQRIARDGDLKADVLGVHRDILEADREVRDQEILLAPLESARATAVRALACATSSAVERHFADVLAAARLEEDRVLGALDTLDEAVSRIAALEPCYVDGRNALKAAGSGDDSRTSAGNVLGSVPRRDREEVRPFAQALRRRIAHAQRARGEPFNRSDL